MPSPQRAWAIAALWAALAVGAAVWRWHWLAATPHVERSVQMAAAPLRCVGGSRDAANLIASFGAESWAAEPRELSVAVGRVVRMLPDRHYVFEADIASGPDPLWAVTGQRIRVGCGRSDRTLRPLSMATRVAFSPDEAWVASAGGYYSSPGCNVGPYPTAGNWLSTDQARGWLETLPDHYGCAAAQALRPELGAAALAFAPSGGEWALAGIESAWCRELKADPKRLAPDPRIAAAGDRVAVKVFGFPKATLRWEAVGAAFDESHPTAPAFCGYSHDGETLLVGWGRWKQTHGLEGGLRLHGFTNLALTNLERIVRHRAMDGERLGEWPIDVPGATDLAVVGVAQESLIALGDGVWGRPLTDAGAWSRLEFPGVGKVTAIKATRDRRRLLLGDATGRLHVVRWP